MSSNYIPELEELYPEIYRELYPFVVEELNELKKRGELINPELINRMIDDIIRKSGLWDEDEDDDYNNFDSQFEDAIPVIAQQTGVRPYNRPYRPNYFRPFRPRRRWHNRNTLRDLLRILALREILK